MSHDIFICYAREDQALLKEFHSHLASLHRLGDINIWHDRNISIGADWQHEIDAHLSSADIILLLISPYFIASEYCYGIEMKKAMERHEQGTSLVVPVILRPTPKWQDHPFGKLQALQYNGQAIATSRPRGKAFSYIVEEIKRATTSFKSNSNKFQYISTLEQTILGDMPASNPPKTSNNNGPTSATNDPTFVDLSPSGSTIPCRELNAIFSMESSRFPERVLFCPDGSCIFVYSSDGKYNDYAEFWRYIDSHRINEYSFVYIAHSRDAYFAFSPDGKRMIVGSGSDIIVYSSITGSFLHSPDLEEERGEIYSITFSPDGRYILCGIEGGRQSTIFMWDSYTYDLLETFHTRDVPTCFAFSPKDHHVLAGLHDGSAIVWDRKADNPSVTFYGHGGRISSAAFSRSGRTVLTGSQDDATTRLWNALTGELLVTIDEKQFSPILHTSFSPKGKRVIICYQDGRVSLWQISGEKKIVPLKKYIASHPISAVYWSSETQLFLAGTKPGDHYFHCFQLDLSSLE